MLDLNRFTIAWRGAAVDLTLTEFWLVHALAKFPGHVKNRDQLMDACYGTNSPAFDRSIDVCVGRLRKKLLDDPPRLIKTVRGVGYVMAKGTE